MLRRGAKITHDKYGKTPMNDAAENEQLEVREMSQKIQKIGPLQIQMGKQETLSDSRITVPTRHVSFHFLGRFKYRIVNYLV